MSVGNKFWSISDIGTSDTLNISSVGLSGFTSTMRSCQPPSIPFGPLNLSFMINWRSGKQSRYSLPITMVGPAGTASKLSTQLTGTPALLKVSACLASRALDISMRLKWIAAKKSLSSLAARSISDIITPRPGPISTNCKVSGLPISRQALINQSPNTSPNICEISGAVIKSLFSSLANPSGSRVG